MHVVSLQCNQVGSKPDLGSGEGHAKTSLEMADPHAIEFNCL